MKKQVELDLDLLAIEIVDRIYSILEEAEVDVPKRETVHEEFAKTLEEQLDESIIREAIISKFLDDIFLNELEEEDED